MFSSISDIFSSRWTEGIRKGYTCSITIVLRGEYPVQTDIFDSTISEVKEHKIIYEALDLIPRSMRPIDLFDGFNTLHAITYSHSLPFIARLSDNIPNIEIILGSPHTLTAENTPLGIVVRNPMVEIEAERIMMEEIQKQYHSDTRLTRITFLIAIGKQSHEKLFLLRNTHNTKKRVVFGSGNLTGAAFHNRQEEGFVFCDNTDVYAHCYANVYSNLRMRSQPPSPTLFKLDKDSKPTPITSHMLPIVLHAEEKQLGVLWDTAKVVGDNDAGLSRAIKIVLPGIPATAPSLKKHMSVADIHSVATHLLGIKAKAKAEKEIIFQAISYDFQQMTITKNDIQIHNISDYQQEDVKQDVALLEEWFNSYKATHYSGGDSAKEFAIRGFQLLLLFALLGPYLTMLNHSDATRDKGGYQYPTLAIVYGDSSGGKTSFIDSLRALTFRTNLETARMTFTASSTTAYRTSSEMGLLIKDDVPAKQIISHLDSIVKTDELAKTALIAPIIVSTNKEVENLDAAVLKRVVPIWIHGKILGVHKKTFPKKIGTALYFDFLKKFKPIYDALEAQTEQRDIFVLASGILATYFTDFKPFTEDEIQHRKYAAFRYEFGLLLERRLRLKTGKDNLVVSKDKLRFQFESIDAAKQFFRIIPEDVTAVLTEKEVTLPKDGLLRVGYELPESVGRKKFLWW